MISAKEAMALDKAKFTTEESASLAQLEAIFDKVVLEAFDGTNIQMKIPANEYSPKVVEAFASCCRRAGWAVQGAPWSEQSKIMGHRETRVVGYALAMTPKDEART